MKMHVGGASLLFRELYPFENRNGLVGDVSRTALSVVVCFAILVSKSTCSEHVLFVLSYK